MYAALSKKDQTTQQEIASIIGNECGEMLLASVVIFFLKYLCPPTNLSQLFFFPANFSFKESLRETFDFILLYKRYFAKRTISLLDLTANSHLLPTSSNHTV